MKPAIIITAFSVIFMFIQNIFSQEVNPDSVKPGKFYKILMQDGNWTEGEILSIDSVYYKIRSTDGTAYKYSKQMIVAFIIPPTEDSEEYYSEKYVDKKIEHKTIMKPSLSISGGFGLTTFERGSSFPASYVFNLEGKLYFSRNAAIRLFVDFNFLGSDRNNYYAGPGYYESYEGGNISVYLFSIDMLLGNLGPEEKTNQYFTCGLGLFVASESGSKYTSTYESSTYSYSYPGSSYQFPGIKLGYGINNRFTHDLSAGGEILYATTFQFLQFGLLSVKPKISYRISKNIELFMEPQYTVPVGFGGYDGLYVGSGYFTIKTGLTLGSF